MFLACVLATPLAAQRPAAPDRDTATAAPTPIPKETSSVTDHTIRAGGQLVPYRATAATMLLKNDKDEAIGVLYYTAYTRTDAKDASQRPLSFIYNGGPGSASACCTWAPSVPPHRDHRRGTHATAAVSDGG
jgi:carboxypeptidase C (cathepsin A)